MSDNYIVINGKRAELTDEQMKVLGIKVDTKRNNPFDRVVNNTYFCITSDNKTSPHPNNDDGYDQIMCNIVNYFNDEAFAEQVALHQLLYRKLLKFAYDNECEDSQVWDTRKAHYLIIYNYYTGEFAVDATGGYKVNTVHFSSEEAAERAIRGVVEPFMEEHPQFVW